MSYLLIEIATSTERTPTESKQNVKDTWQNLIFLMNICMPPRMLHKEKKQYKTFNHPGVHHIWYHLLSKEGGLKLFSKNYQVKNNSSNSGRCQEAQCTTPPFNTNTLLLTESIWNVKGYRALPPRASLWTISWITESFFIFSLLFLSPLPSLRF